MHKPRQAMAKAVIALAVALFATLGIAAPASAATLASSEEACFLNIDTGEYGCYTTEAALDTALAIRGAQLTTSARSSVTAAASAVYTYARLYADSNYGGAALTLTGSSSSGCAGGYSSSANLPSAWNDRVSSFMGYLSCKVRLAEHSNQGGTLYGPFSSATSLGSFNDKASSFRIVD